MFSAKWLLALLLLLTWPSVSQAGSFSNLQEKLIFQPDNNLYRLRASDRGWQLSSLLPNTVAKQTLTYSDRLYLVGATDSQRQLYSSERGLRLEIVNIPTADELKIKTVGDSLLVVSQKDGAIRTDFINQNGQLTNLGGLALTNVTELERIGGFDDEIVALIQDGDSVGISVVTDSGWQTVATIDNCPNSQALFQPSLFLSCQDQYFYPQSLNNWQPLFPESIRSSVSDGVVAAQSNANLDRFFIWQSGTLLTIDVADLENPDQVSLTALGQRLFIRTTKLYELNYLLPELLVVGDQPTAFLTKAENDPRLYRQDTDFQYQSDQIGNWVTITTEGGFNRVRKVTNGWLLYQLDDDLTQFGQDTIYHEIDTSWAATSRIQELTEYQGVTYLFLFNSSNKSNLYKTTDFSGWTRVTLPTTATLTPTISEARLLSSGAELEIEGVVTVPPGIVDSEILYLGTDTAGIQIFLSVAKGKLPNVRDRVAVVNGEISSSQAKRVILDAASDIELGSGETVTRILVTADQADSLLGRTVDLKGKLTAVAGDYLSLERAASVLKLHFQSLAQTYQKNDLVQVAAVVDYNSSSGQTEAWALNLTDQLLDRPTTQPDDPGLTENSAKVSVSTNNSSTESKKATAESNSTSKPIAAKVAETKLNQLSPAKKTSPPVQVAAARTRTIFPAEVTIMSLVSLIAGLLAVRGRRLRKLFTLNK